jgi:signal transduction histidine kinase
MTLTARIMVFFLAAFGVVLAGFSLTLYGAARTYLNRRTEARLESTLRVLTSAAEIDAGLLEWEPQERMLLFDNRGAGDSVLWLVTDERGSVIDASSQWTGSIDLHSFEGEGAQEYRASDGTPWLGGQRWIRAPQGGHAPAAAMPPGKYRALAIMAAVPLGPVQSSLRLLAWALASISAAILAAAGAAGRWYCRRALTPVTAMAESARDLRIEEGQRLSYVQTDDELSALGKAFNAVLDQLYESLERQRRFTGDASHQLRTPLSGMLGQIEVALRRPRTEEVYRETLECVRNQVLHLRGIVEGLLFLARADADADARTERLDLAHWLRGHLQPWRAHERGPDIRLDISGSDTAWVQGQSTLLGQLLDNVLDNACKYSPPGTPITVRLETQKDEILVSITDQGPGIPPLELERVFRPFYRSENARNEGKPGVGLGLAIAARIAKALGGDLTVQPASPRGLRLTLRLARAAGTDLRGEPEATDVSHQNADLTRA